jgi:Ca-activated chloride channel family protein
MDCQDTVLKVPFAQAATNRSFITAALAATHARGLTLIAHALRQAASDFTNNVAGRTIVLISDGAESCGGDPCITAIRLAGEGFVINVIAFNADPLPGRKLMCIAKGTGGEFSSARTAAQLQDRLVRALGVCPIAFAPSRAQVRNAFG